MIKSKNKQILFGYICLGEKWNGQLIISLLRVNAKDLGHCKRISHWFYFLQVIYCVWIYNDTSLKQIHIKLSIKIWYMTIWLIEGPPARVLGRKSCPIFIFLVQSYVKYEGNSLPADPMVFWSSNKGKHLNTV